MKNLVLSLLLILINFNIAIAASDFEFDKVKKEGDLFEEKSCDIDGDKTPEKIALKAYGLYAENNEIIRYYGQLVVAKKKGEKYETIWEGPKFKDEEIFEKNEFRFVFADFGLEPIEAAGDVFGDGKTCLLSPIAQSDVSPASYRVYAWNKNKFEFVKFESLLCRSEAADKFKWEKHSAGDVKNLAWIGRIKSIVKPGEIEAEIWAVSGDATKLGRAVLKVSGEGFDVTKWLEPLKKLEY
ncbi:MAG TPA: hypothetical protein PKK26_10140 [Candidatus Wallbacteria bacterium]|nr:hypothetical protein [Candidatus Wallbacteria bacterium]